MPLSDDLMEYLDSCAFALKLERHLAIRVVELLYTQVPEALRVSGQKDAM